MSRIVVPRQVLLVEIERRCVDEGVVAVVRARRLGPDNIPRLHLEFVDKQWPLEEST